ncbi:hypothetical protein OQA88_1261 [Cercophora sp. LCS_1]
MSVKARGLDSRFHVAGAEASVIAKCLCKSISQHEHVPQDVYGLSWHVNAHDLPVLDVVVIWRDLDKAPGDTAKESRLVFSFTLHDDGSFPFRSVPWRFCRQWQPYRHPVARPAIANKQIHWDTIKSWLDGDPVVETIPSIHVRLIDVLYDEVVHPPWGASYIALSYVWGGVKQHTAMSTEFIPSTETSPDYRYGREYLPLNRPALARTIQDAMALVREMGQRYLWVDVLCIMQDDKRELDQTFRGMSSIYASSLVTTVAASGNDANYGLPGIRSSSRKVIPVVGVVDSVPLILAEPGPRLGETKWAARAWTFQEACSSRRWLVFSEDRVLFSRSDGEIHAEARPESAFRDAFRESLMMIKDEEC